jgi:hypothetical protein
MSLEMTDAGVISMPVELPGDFEDETAYAYCPGRSTCFMPDPKPARHTRALMGMGDGGAQG